jgi:hypothetical protein
MLIKETDFGTPKSEATQMVTLEIDGHSITVPEGTSIMRAAMELGTKIPKLCATDSLNSFGSCRLCLVEIEGRKGTPASCTTPVAAGIKVKTQSDRLGNLRKGVMELYISDHPLDCLTCAANGDCELQDMAGAVGLRDVRYGYDGDNHVFAKREGVGAILTSRLTLPSASSARAVFGLAKKCKAHSRSPLMGADLHRMSQQAWMKALWPRNVFHAAHVCKLAPQPHSLKNQ